MTKNEILRILQSYKLNDYSILVKGEYYKKINTDTIKDYLDTNMHYIIQLRFFRDFCIQRLYNNGSLGPALVWCNFK